MTNTQILLLRHGLTPWNAEGRWQGQEDVPLSEEGLRQAELVAERIANWGINAIYSSDLKRAWDTAAAVTTRRGDDLEIISDPRWRERHAGEFQGLIREQIAEKFPEKLKELEQGIIAPVHGETPEVFNQRILESFEEIVARHPGEQVLIVSHGGAIRSILGSILSLPRDEIWKFSLGNTSLSRIQTSDRGYQISLWNDTAHLEGVETTNPSWSITL